MTESLAKVARAMDSGVMDAGNCLFGIDHLSYA
jgi:hypothetical protein